MVLVPGTAFASQLIASKVVQPAQYTIDSKNWVKINPGMVMPKVGWIHTGRRGRLLLRRDQEMIMYRPNTLALLRSSQTNGRNTVIKQEFGSLLLDVETRRRKHVTVQTPYLAAVVKGTRFEVTVKDGKASVSVERGVVGVLSNKSGNAFDVTPGQTASVSSASANEISLSGPGASQLAQSGKPTLEKSSSNSDVNRNSNGENDSDNSNSSNYSNGN